MTQSLLAFADDLEADRVGVEWAIQCSKSLDELERLRDPAEELGLVGAWRRRRKELQSQEGNRP